MAPWLQVWYLLAYGRIKKEKLSWPSFHSVIVMFLAFMSIEFNKLDHIVICYHHAQSFAHGLQEQNDCLYFVTGTNAGNKGFDNTVYDYLKHQNTWHFKMTQSCTEANKAIKKTQQDVKKHLSCGVRLMRTHFILWMSIGLCGLVVQVEHQKLYCCNSL